MPKFLPTIATASLILAAAVSSPATAAAGKVISQPNGRFAFGQISDARRDQFMLDTATGELWTLSCVQVDKKKTGMDQCVFSALTPVLYMTGENKYSLTPAPARPPSK